MQNYQPAPYEHEVHTFHVTAGSSTLMRQAQMTAHTYMDAAIKDIDELLGTGYARKHPELIAAYMQTAAIDFGSGIIARAVEHIERVVENAVEVWAETNPE